MSRSLGVAGGIAAYKACELLRRLHGAGHEVTVVPTAAALDSSARTTWAALSGQPVHTAVFDDAQLVPHVKLGQEADLVVVAPATADLLARAAYGSGRRPAHQRPADRPLPGGLRAGHAHRDVAAPGHPGQRRHPARARRRRARPRFRPADRPGLRPRTAARARRAVRRARPRSWPNPASPRAPPSRDLAGLRVAVSAGGTREHLDPVRFLGNSSSGLMGWALARAAALRGADVTLVAANVDPAGTRPGTEVEAVDLDRRSRRGDDRRRPRRRHRRDGRGSGRLHPGRVQRSKIKKSAAEGPRISRWSRPPTCWPDWWRRRTDPGQVIVGFAAETPTGAESLVELGRAKLARKGCDLLVLNEVGRGRVFGQPRQRDHPAQTRRRR